MTINRFYKKLERLDYLIRRQATGAPKDLAECLGISSHSLYKLITSLSNQKQVSIKYCKERFSYVYDLPSKNNLNFKRNRFLQASLVNGLGGTVSYDLLSDEIDIVDCCGGYNDEARNAFLEDADQDKAIMDYINFNDLFFD
jgi:hypothetical protein